MINMNTREMTTAQLAQQFQLHPSSTCFDEIYRRVKPGILSLCLRFVKDRSTAQDLFQDIMVKVITHLPKLKHPELFELWIRRIAKNYCIDYCEQHARKRWLPTDDYHHLEAFETDWEQLLEKEKLLESLPQVMAFLKPEDQQLLTQKYLNGASVETLQESLSLSESAVKMRLSRARKRLLQLLSSQLKEAHLAKAV